MDDGTSLAPRPDDPGKGLSRPQFEEVIRRASELAATDAEPGTSLSEAELFRIASEVGLPAAHVKTALAEVRSRPVPSGPFQALARGPWVRVSRVVPGTREEVTAAIDRFLVGGRLLQPVRKGKEQLVYWPAKDWVSQIARAASSTGKRYYIASAKRVEVTLHPVTEDTTLVEFAVDPGIHGEHFGGAVVSSVIGGGAGGVGTTLLVAGAAPLAVGVLAGVAAGGAIMAGISYLVGRNYLSQLERVHLEVEGVLDRLERQEEPAPPPASWRQWVSRNFGGVARELGFEEDQ